MNIKELTNGNYWLVQVSYPIAGQATLYNKIYDSIPTKNGYHIITKPFNL